MASLPLRRNREFMLLWSGQALSSMGSQVSSVAYPLLVLAVTGSAAKAGIVGFAKWILTGWMVLVSLSGTASSALRNPPQRDG